MKFFSGMFLLFKTRTLRRIETSANYYLGARRLVTEWRRPPAQTRLYIEHENVQVKLNVLGRKASQLIDKCNMTQNFLMSKLECL